MKKTKEKQDLPFFLRGGMALFLSSLLCIVLGVLIGYISLLIINPNGANTAILAILKNFFYFKKPKKIMYYFGSTLMKSTPLILCSLSVIFANKAGLFNIGASGQYTAGACAALFLAYEFHMPWYVCMIAAILAGMIVGMITGALKAYRNVHEVISGIMINWIALYIVNDIMVNYKSSSQSLTYYLADVSPQSITPTLGFGKLFGGNSFVGIALIITPVVVIIFNMIINKTKSGYELKVTGYNPNAALYCGMKSKYNIMKTMAISGGIAGLAAALIFLSDIEQWLTTTATVPSVGFDGIAAAFLGGLNPIGAIFSSIFIKHITLGGAYIDKTMFSTQTADLITSLIIYFCAFAQFVRIKAADSYKRRMFKKEHFSENERSVG